MEETKIEIGTLNRGDIVFSKTFGGCALISEHAHSYDTCFQCKYIWNAKEHSTWICESVSLDDIRKPTWEETCEFLRAYQEITDVWEKDSESYAEFRKVFLSIIDEMS